MTELEKKNGEKLPVIEMFDSIQGEGSWIGRPVTFIRLAGCNLNCSWCDTDWSLENSWTMTVQEIYDRLNWRDVVITGGEPLIHNLWPLLKAIKLPEDKIGFSSRQVAIETNGTQNTAQYLGYIDWIVCSPKPPKYYTHPLCVFDELKYVVDEKWDPSLIPDIWLKEHAGKIWLQPEASQMKERWKDCYKYAQETPGLRVGLQLHKLMEVQ